MQIVVVLVAIMAVLATVSGKSLRSGDGDEPWFCHGIDCPSYSNTTTDSIEVRSYSTELWSSTDVYGVSLDDAMDTGFNRLFNYISGANEGSVAIPMTAPVKVTLTPGDGPESPNPWNWINKIIQTLRAFRRAHICMQLQKDISNLYDMLAILIDSCMDVIPSMRFRIKIVQKSCQN